MRNTLLLTGASGAVGIPLLIDVLRARRFSRVIATSRGRADTLLAQLRAEAPDLDTSRLSIVRVDLAAAKGAQPLVQLSREIDCIIHAAACTKFRAASAELTRVNVEGTRQLLSWAETLSQPPRFIHLSTTCVAGQRSGNIPEQPLPDEVGFVNAYERTKWEAEQVLARSPLQPEIVRLATLVGSAVDGRLGRPGAFHTTLRWLQAGLLPMVPGGASTRLDLLPTEAVTSFLLRLLERPRTPHGIYHVSNGDRGIPLTEMLDFAADRFRRHNSAWRTGQILPPIVATRAAFDAFRLTIERSRDAVFNRVLESVDSFLPELFYPKCYETTRATQVFDVRTSFSDWRDWMGRVLDVALQRDTGPATTRAA